MATNISKPGHLKHYRRSLLLIAVVALLVLSVGQSFSRGEEKGVQPYPNAPASFTELVKRGHQKGDHAKSIRQRRALEGLFRG